MFLLLFFTIIVTVLVTATVSTQFFQSLNKITTLSHTQQKLISRRGIGTGSRGDVFVVRTSKPVQNL